MKKLLIASAVLVLASCGSTNTDVTGDIVTDVVDTTKEVQLDGSYTLQTDMSSIGWLGSTKPITKTHNGTIDATSGDIVFEDNSFVSGSLLIDMQTINVLDLQGGGKEGLEGHLESDDFFAVATYPESTLVLNNVEKQEDGTYNIIADLTIKSITNPITFDADISEELGKLVLSSDFDIDRTLWGVQYGSDKVADSLKDSIISDTISYDIELVFMK